MAQAVAARMKGDDYQALVFWKYAVKMLSDDSEIAYIEFENGEIKSFDDIVVHYAFPQRFCDHEISTEYIQVKFHVTGNGAFTFDSLIDPSFINAAEKSFLDKVKTAKEKLGDRFFESKFIIYSPWAISQEDTLYEYIDNTDGTLRLQQLFNGTTDKSKSGKIRKKLRTALHVTDESLKEILGQIEIFSSMENKQALIDLLNCQFNALGLKTISGSSGTNPYVDITRSWIQDSLTKFNKEKLVRECRKAQLLKQYDGHNTDEYFKEYRGNVVDKYNKMTLLLDRSTKYDLLGENGIYVGMYVDIADQQVLMNSLASVEEYGNRFVICANGGYGKSMLMKKLLLDPDDVRRFVPVLLSLRNISLLNPGECLLNAIKEEFSDNHVDITIDEIITAFKVGKLLLLLDGLDEVKSENRMLIEKEILETAEKYPNSPIIVSSRPFCVSKDFDTCFKRVNICPLDEQQAKEFIYKIAQNKTLADTFCLKLDAGLYSSHKDFVDNPLLLTLMLLVFKRNRGIPDSLADFYYVAFECLYKNHDIGKGNFQREFRTKLLGDLEFKNLLAFMCFYSYFSEDYDFDDRYIKEVIEKGKKYLGINEKLRVPEDYLFDLENNVCLLIKEGGEYRFIHRSFQTYFSAVFAMEFISDSKQKLLFSKMVSGDRFSDFKEFFKFLYGLEGKRCLDNLFAEFKTFYIENGEDKYFSLLRLIFEDIGLEMAGKGSRHADSYYEISDSDDFVYDIAFRKREKNEKSIRLYELYLSLCPLKYRLTPEETKNMCRLIKQCDLMFEYKRLLVMPIDNIRNCPSGIRYKILDYSYRYFGIIDLIEYVEEWVEKDRKDDRDYFEFPYYLAGIL